MKHEIITSGDDSISASFVAETLHTTDPSDCAKTSHISVIYTFMTER